MTTRTTTNTTTRPTTTRRGRERRGRATRSRTPTPAKPPDASQPVSTRDEPMTSPTPAVDRTDPASDLTGRRGPSAGQRNGADPAGPHLARGARRSAGGAVEGLAWLGRPPEAKASLLYRLLRAGRPLRDLRACSGFASGPRVRSTCRAGGYLLVAAAHRGWMDPFVVMHAHPARAARLVPRQRAVDVHVALARAADPSVGGLLPVWRGGVGIDQHVASARAVIANGAVFVQMPEGTVSGPPGRIGAVPRRLGGHRAADRRADRAARDRRDRGAVPRPAAGLAGPAGHHGPCPGRARAAGAAFPRRARARSSTLAHRMSDALADDPRPGRRGALPVDGRSAGPAAAAPKRLTWLLLRPGRLDRDG